MTRKIHTSRPKSLGARVAWDFFSRIRQQEPVRLWYCCLSYWVWVAEYADGETDDIDNLSLHSDREKARAFRAASRKEGENDK